MADLPDQEPISENQARILAVNLCRDCILAAAWTIAKPMVANGQSSTSPSPRSWGRRPYSTFRRDTGCNGRQRMTSRGSVFRFRREDEPRQ